MKGPSGRGEARESKSVLLLPCTLQAERGGCFPQAHKCPRRPLEAGCRVESRPRLLLG